MNPSNRTILELKPFTLERQIIFNIPSNRTILELKRGWVRAVRTF